MQISTHHPLTLSKMYIAYCRYKEVLLMLLTELLKKIQFRHNQSQLEELDDESLDDDVS